MGYDILGSLLCTTCAKRYILVAVNNSYEVAGGPVNSGFSDSSLCLLPWLHLIRGTPKHIMMDQGHNFESSLIMELCQQHSKAEPSANTYTPDKCVDGKIEFHIYHYHVTVGLGKPGRLELAVDKALCQTPAETSTAHTPFPLTYG